MYTEADFEIREIVFLKLFYLYIPGDGAGVTGTLSKVKFEYIW